jgi:hypothetical protein
MTTNLITKKQIEQLKESTKRNEIDPKAIPTIENFVVMKQSLENEILHSHTQADFMRLTQSLMDLKNYAKSLVDYFENLCFQNIDPKKASFFMNVESNLEGYFRILDDTNLQDDGVILTTVCSCISYLVEVDYFVEHPTQQEHDHNGN